MIELCFFSLDQWEIKIHLLWGKCFNIPHWPRSHSTNRRLQHIEKLSKTYSGDPHLDQTKLNGLLLLTIHGVLINQSLATICPNLSCLFLSDNPNKNSIMIGTPDRGQQIKDIIKDHQDGPASCKWSSGWTGLLQMIILMDRPSATDHLDGPASCKWSSWWTSLLRMIILMGWPLGNDHPDQPSSCK